MSGGTKQQFKQFSINCVEDACIVMGMLISGVSINLDKYKEYAAEANELFKNNDGEFVPAKDYDDVNDKLLYRQREILKFTADHQSCSFSYIDLRKLLEKNHYISSPLLEEVSDLLAELLNVRNWTFHNPQSLMVAAKDAAEKAIPDELKEIVQITHQLNPVLIRKISQYEAAFLASLLIHTEIRIEQFEKVLTSMKRDYQEMYESIENTSLLLTANGCSNKVQYVERYEISRLSDYHSDIAQISMAIQKSKYDGTEEKYREWVIRTKT